MILAPTRFGRLVRRAIARWLLVGIVFLSATSAHSASFIPIEGSGDLNGLAVEASDVSADGSTVVGVLRYGQDTIAYRWTAATGIVVPEDITDAPTPATSARGVSADGSVFVGQGHGATALEAAVWNVSTGVQGIGPLSDGSSSSPSEATAVSANGEIVTGNSRGAPEAFIWDAAQGMQGLGFLSGYTNSRARDISSDGSVVVGFAVGDPAPGTFRPIRQGFIWDATNGMRGLGDLDIELLHSEANAVSADGATVVGLRTTDMGTDAFAWNENDGMIDLGDLPGGGNFAEAWGVSGDGQIVVGRAYAGDHYEAFIWDAENGMQSLAYLLTSQGIDLEGWTLTQASAISPDGRFITGEATNPAGDDVSFLAVIPEPSTALLLAMGLTGLAGRRKCRAG
jgi:probable HAF family extracellular repeat protein